ncbi:cytochrome ubiquinol oxidase subunit II [Robbsia sp. KACC 23696]|uniref:cytochrome ubiquinol oxidase subunit II n=1 Tax=Robbsia sp. KACC 23696 TaxID=3149231 RepID=UPI00325B5788
MSAKHDQPDVIDQRPRTKSILRDAYLCVIPLALSGCASDIHRSFLDPQGPIAAIQQTHFFEMVAILAIFVALPVFILLPWFAWRYRFGAKSSRYAPNWASSTPLEVIAWSGPVVIVAVLGTLVWRSTHALDPYRPILSPNSALRVQVIGYDWKWLFLYPDLGIASIGVLAIPTGQPVAMDITSATAMQSLLIPSLGSQMYAMGGMVTQLHLLANKPGRFMGENTMYNGNGFHAQQFSALAMSAQEFQSWVKQRQSASQHLDAGTLSHLAQPSTQAQLALALGVSKDAEGGIYFSHVDPAVFPSIVKATMNGTAFTRLATGTTSTMRVAHGYLPSTPIRQDSNP